MQRLLWLLLLTVFPACAQTKPRFHVGAEPIERGLLATL